VRQLDALFSELTDPGNYWAGTSYDVRRAFQAGLSGEQLFRNVQSIVTRDRDSHSRRGLMFDSLDTLEGLRIGPDVTEMTTLKTVGRDPHHRRALVTPPVWS